MKKLVDIKSVIQSSVNSVTVIMSDGNKIDIITQPSDSSEDLFIKVVSDKPLKIDFQVRSKP